MVASEPFRRCEMAREANHAHKDRDGSLPSRSYVLVFSDSGNVEERNAPFESRDVAGIWMAALRGLSRAAE